MPYDAPMRMPLATGWSCFAGLRLPICIALLGCFGAGWICSASAIIHASNNGSLRCHARLPSVVGGWNTMLAECDGRPVGIGLSTSTRASAKNNNQFLDSAEYTRDLQAIRGVLSSGRTPTPNWVPVVAILLALALAGGLIRLLRGLLGPLSQPGNRRVTQPSVLPVAQNSGHPSTSSVSTAADLPCP